MICSGCGAEAPDADVFCETCGQRLQPAPPDTPACSCGTALAEADEDGFCPGCGRRVRRPASDHIRKVQSASFAGVSDRGLEHHANEDRFVLIEEADGWAAVVCDGVSSTREAEVASATVATVAGEALRQFLREAEGRPAEEALLQAIAAGGAALAERCTGRSDAESPATTVVAALVRDRRLTLAWAGDSRAYWIGSGGVPVQLTVDHSWVAQAIREGGLTAREAESAPEAHAILRWISGDAGASEGGPETSSLPLHEAGTLLLCTDGLWNYAASPEAMGAVLASVAGEDAVEMAHHLIGFALAQGGRDNVTAVVLRWSPATEPSIEPALGETRMEQEGPEDAAAVQG